MEWWSFFRKVRRISFGVVAVVCLLWAIFLSVYLAREWKHAPSVQRIIVLVMVLVYIFSSVLLYLMVVVIFHLWPEFWRTIFLFGLHLGVALPLSLLGRSFNCVVFNSAATCTNVYIFALSIVWSLVVFFVLHAVALCVMSGIPIPEPEADPEEEFIQYAVNVKDDVEKGAESRTSRSPVSHAERLRAVPARLVTVSRDYGVVGDASSVHGSISDLPTLPYGMSSLDGFIKPGSPAPSYSSEDPSRERFVQFPSRRARPLLLNQNVAIPATPTRRDTPDSMASVSTLGSRESARSRTADVTKLQRPPLAVIADHRRSISTDSLPLSAVPPQLRPRTPASHRHSRSDASSMYSTSEQIISMYTSSRAVPRTPTSVHSITASLLFMEPGDSRAPSPSQHQRSGSNASQRSYLVSSGLSRQPTARMHLPNPFVPIEEVPSPPAGSTP